MAEKLGSASSSSNKRMKKAEIDRLSALRDSLLMGILRLLSTQEAIRTCVLSRRWLFLWTDLPELEFREGSFDNEKISKFVAWVYRYLLICGRNHLQRFEVSFHYNECFASDVNAWVQFALKHKVEDVALLLDGRCRYLLPQMMYSNSYLTCLRLQGCIVAPKNTIEWGALSSLYLGRVEFHGNAIEMILSGCPVLYDLILEHCSGLNSLNVESPSLRKLALIGCDDDEDEDDEYFLEISAPFIHYLKISVYLPGRKLRLSKISPLVEADIDFEAHEPDVMPGFIRHATELFQNLCHVKELKVGPEFIRDGFKKLVFERKLLRLKTVTIEVKSILAAELMLTLVQLLLKSALAIQKMVIEFTLFSLEYSPDDYIEIAQTLLSYPRASTKAAVVLAPVKFSC